MTEKIEGFDGKRLDEESTFSVETIANPHCSKCYGTGRLGFVHKKGKRYAILCTAKGCAEQRMRAMQYAYRVQKAKEKKEAEKLKREAEKSATTKESSVVQKEEEKEEREE